MKCLALALVWSGCTSQGLSSAPFADQACWQAPGSPHAYTTAIEVNALAVGTWVRCAGPVLTANETIGFAINADFTYDLLSAVEEGSSSTRVVLLGGFGNQGEWDTYQEPTAEVQISLHLRPAAGTPGGGDPSFTDAPRRMTIRDSTYTLITTTP